MNTQLYLRVHSGNVYCFGRPNSKSRPIAIIPEGASLLVKSIHNKHNDPSADGRYAFVTYLDKRTQKITSGFVSLQSTHLDIEPVVKTPIEQ